MASPLSIYSFLVFNMIPLSYGQQNMTSSLADTVNTTPPSYSTQWSFAPTIPVRVSSTTNHYFSSRHTLGSPSSQVKSPNPSFIDQPTSQIAGSVDQSGKHSATTAPPFIMRTSNYILAVFSTASTKLPNNSYSAHTVVSDLPVMDTSSTHVSNGTSRPSISKVMPTPSPSIMQNLTLTSVVQTSSKVMAKSSSTLMPYLPPTSAVLNQISSEVMANSSSTPIPYLQPTSAVLNQISSKVIAKSSSTLMPYLPPTSAVLNQISSEVMANSSSTPIPYLQPTSAVLNQTSSKVIAKSSSTFMPYLPPTSAVLNQISSKVMANSSSTPMPYLNPTSAALNQTALNSTLVVVDKTLVFNQTSSKVIANSNSAIMNSGSVTLSRVLKSIMASGVEVSPTAKERPTMLSSQTPNTTNHSTISTFTAAIGASCYTNNNLMTCVRLQPSTNIQYNSTSRGATASTRFIDKTSFFIGNRSSAIGNQSTKAPDSQHEEKKHTTLIVGLAVGISLGVVLVILIIVYYRRKRASYQYNVFYDEQNIVMHPFDYSK